MRPSYSSTTALLVVDVQNDFADPDGALAVRGGVDVVAASNREIGAARSHGALVIYTADWHPPDTPHFTKDGGVWPVHCVADTWGAAFHPDLVVDGPVVRKGTGGEDGYSGFTVRHPVTGETTSTGLAERLDAAAVSDVVVVGLATDYCVKETALDARRAGLDVVVVSDAVAAVDVHDGDGAAALDEMADSGVRLA